MSRAASEDPKPAGQFQATRWSIVLAARERSTPAGEAALGWLCERYWQPLTAWARAKGLSPEDSEDLVQGFFAQALKGGLVGSAEASRGRFRSYLLGCLEHHWTDERRRGSAQKRGGGRESLPLHGHTAEEAIPEISSGRTPEEEYDRSWAAAVLDRAMSRLKDECDADGHSGRFAVLRIFLDGDRGELPLADAAEQLGLSMPALKSAVHRLRRRMAEMVREEISETVQSPEDVEEELRALFAALRG